MAIDHPFFPLVRRVGRERNDASPLFRELTGAVAQFPEKE